MKVVLVLAVVSAVVAIPGWQAAFRAFYPRGGIIWGNTACIGKRGGARRSLAYTILQCSWLGYYCSHRQVQPALYVSLPLQG